MNQQDKIVFERSFNLQQKLIIMGFSLFPLLFIIVLLEQNLNWKGYLIFIVALLLFLYLIALAFSRKGLIKKEQFLYKGKIFRGYTLFKQKIDLTDRPVVSILKFKKRQKFAFFSVAKPDLSHSFNSFEIFVLNANHFKRDSVMYFKEEKSANKAIEFLTRDFPFTHEIFSPQYVRKRGTY